MMNVALFLAVLFGAVGFGLWVGRRNGRAERRARVLFGVRR